MGMNIGRIKLPSVQDIEFKGGKTNVETVWGAGLDIPVIFKDRPDIEQVSIKAKLFKDTTYTQELAVQAEQVKGLERQPSEYGIVDTLDLRGFLGVSNVGSPKSTSKIGLRDVAIDALYMPISMYKPQIKINTVRDIANDFLLTGRSTLGLWKNSKNLEGATNLITRNSKDGAIQIATYGSGNLVSADADNLYDMNLGDVKVFDDTNLLQNSDFDRWSVDYSVAPDGWYLYVVNASITREITTVKNTLYSAKITRAGTDCYLSNAAPGISNPTPGYTRYLNKTVTFGMWVYATVASRARIAIDDGVTTTYSSYHSGAAGWEWLTVSKTIAANATKIETRNYINTGDTSAYFANGALIEGSTITQRNGAAEEAEWIEVFGLEHSFKGMQVIENGIIRLKISGVVIEVWAWDNTNSKYKLVNTIKPQNATGTYASSLDDLDWNVLNPDWVKATLTYNNCAYTINMFRGLPWAEVTPSVASFEMMPQGETRCVIPNITSWNTNVYANNPWANPLYPYWNWYGIGWGQINTGTAEFRDISGYTSYINIGHLGSTYWQYTQDALNDLYSIQFYLNNNLQKVSATTITACDAMTDWSIITGVGSIALDGADKQEGSNSIYNASGLTDSSGVFVYRYNPAAAINLSGKEFIEFWIKSSIAGDIICSISDGTNTKSWTGSRFAIAAGVWTRFVLPILAPQGTTGSLPTTVIGTLNIAAIDFIDIGIDTTSNSAAITVHIDDVCADVGQWVKVEAYVPDSLLAAATALNLYSWNGSAYQKFLNWHPTSVSGTIDSTKLFTMDGTKASEQYGASLGAAGFAQGLRTAAGARNVGDSGAGTITYSSYYGCQNRIGFAIKLPPDDGKDSSTTGISQAKIKLEVFYAGDGKATFEFENSANTYYGLTNINSPYCVMHKPAAAEQCSWLTLTKKPNALFVTADENELLTRIRATWAAVPTLLIGIWDGDTITDTNLDGIPNFLSTDSGEDAFISSKAQDSLRISEPERELKARW